MDKVIRYIKIVLIKLGFFGPVAISEEEMKKSRDRYRELADKGVAESKKDINK